MEAALELIRRGVVRGSGETVASVIDQRTTLPQLIAALMNIFDASRFADDAEDFRRLAMDMASAALDRAGFEFSYINDGEANLRALHERLKHAGVQPPWPDDP
jgi:hypothetical protein